MSRRFTVVAWAVVTVLGGLAALGAQSGGEARRKIAELEKKLAALRSGEFDWALHNELRHWYGAVDERKSMVHCDVILKHSRMDGYMILVLGGKDPTRAKALAAMTARAMKYADLPNLAAACWVRAAELATDRTAAAAYYRKALAVRGLAPTYRELVEARLASDVGARRPWPKEIPAPKGMQDSPGPWSDPADTSAWPNRTSRANSDPWLARNHDRLRVMRPRLLLLNFSNEHPREHIELLTRRLIKALAESSRYHGYKNPKAPAFLRYEVFKLVDLRDQDRRKYDSRLMPLKDPKARRGFNVKYRAFFSEEFARHYGVPDPRQPGRYLRLDELVDGGYVHEVWLFGSGSEEPGVQQGAFEVVELMPRYDAKFRKVGDEFVQAGNGGDPDQPWTGRSVRIGFVNASRGIGCFLESLAHGMEGMSNSHAIPYFTRYFREYAGFDLRERFGLPFDSLYAVKYGERAIRYPDPKTMVVRHGDKEYRVEKYVCAGGNAHFPPNARGHYDMDNAEPVLSTIEDWRIGSGKGGKDLARPFTHKAFRNYRDLAPDCMGAWLVYWRQNMPGLDNRQRDGDGMPMKNWLPFLFY
jgi:hypothetical protein